MKERERKKSPHIDSRWSIHFNLFIQFRQPKLEGIGTNAHKYVQKKNKIVLRGRNECVYTPYSVGVLKHNKTTRDCVWNVHTQTVICLKESAVEWSE